MSQKRHSAGLVFICITVILDMLALGMIIPVLPKLVEFYAGSTQRAAEIFGVFGTAWALMQFLFSPLIGALSDRFGRRPIVLMSNVGLGLDYILMAMAPDLVWLFVGRVISGITAASISTSYAYIADVTPGEKRARAFGLIGMCFGLGFVMGPALGGFLAAWGPRMPFWMAAGMSLTNALYGLLILPESLSRDRRSPFLWRRANPLGSMQLLKRRRPLMGLAMINFLDQLAHVVFPSTFVLYASYRLAMGAKAVGLTLTAVGVCAMIVQGGLVEPIIKRLGEKSTLMLGLVSGAAAFALYGLTNNVWIFWMTVPLGSLWGLAAPSMQSMMSRMVSETEQGKLQGANTSLSGIAQLIGPTLFTLSFSAALETAWLPLGIPFLLSGLLVSGACLAGLWTFREMRLVPAAAE